MTAPVLVRIIPGQGPACKDDFRMSFFISPKLHDAPKPTNPNVTLSSLPSQTVYVRYQSNFFLFRLQGYFLATFLQQSAFNCTFNLIEDQQLRVLLKGGTKNNFINSSHH